MFHFPECSTSRSFNVIDEWCWKKALNVCFFLFVKLSFAYMHATVAAAAFERIQQLKNLKLSKLFHFHFVPRHKLQFIFFVKQLDRCKFFTITTFWYLSSEVIFVRDFILSAEFKTNIRLRLWKLGNFCKSASVCFELLENDEDSFKFVLCFFDFCS